MVPDLRLHHFGVLVKDLEKAKNRYVGSFGYEVKSEVIHDPLQTAFVQFLRLPQQPTYLELISPDGPQSVLQLALKKNGGVHHVCYTTPDLCAAIEQFTNDGNILVSEPKPAVAFNQRKIAWLMTRDYLLFELVQQGPPDEL
jgi:methylmalonyl-CoA/ethylmalonyl-CoA epimerase